MLQLNEKSFCPYSRPCSLKIVEKDRKVVEGLVNALEEVRAIWCPDFKVVSAARFWQQQYRKLIVGGVEVIQDVFSFFEFPSVDSTGSVFRSVWSMKNVFVHTTHSRQTPQVVAEWPTAGSRKSAHSLGNPSRSPGAPRPAFAVHAQGSRDVLPAAWHYSPPTAASSAQRGVLALASAARQPPSFVVGQGERPQPQRSVGKCEAAARPALLRPARDAQTISQGKNRFPESAFGRGRAVGGAWKKEEG